MQNRFENRTKALIKIITKREGYKNTICDSIASLSETDWEVLLNIIAPNEAYGSFIKAFAKM